jgi:hypothetical protein
MMTMIMRSIVTQVDELTSVGRNTIVLCDATCSVRARVKNDGFDMSLLGVRMDNIHWQGGSAHEDIVGDDDGEVLL